MRPYFSESLEKKFPKAIMSYVFVATSQTSFCRSRVAYFPAYSRVAKSLDYWFIWNLNLFFSIHSSHMPRWILSKWRRLCWWFFRCILHVSDSEPVKMLYLANTKAFRNEFLVCSPANYCVIIVTGYQESTTPPYCCKRGKGWKGNAKALLYKYSSDHKNTYLSRANLKTIPLIWLAKSMIIDSCEP